ncbi:MAG TPA: hypothetical protein VHD90_16900 [Phototrophicaceae bacterium]|nr:hypothetical protein [Phototrophicaceae bacterium]
MLRYLARLSIGIAVVICLLVVSVHLIGGATSPPKSATLQQFDCTPKPCWHDIQLGITTIPEAAAILGTDRTLRLFNYQPTADHVCWQWQNEWHSPGQNWDSCYNDVPNSQTVLILNYENSPLRLGDVIDILDRPDATSLCRLGMTSWQGYLYAPRMWIHVNVPNEQSVIDPKFPVQQIVYSLVAYRPPYYIHTPGWRGLFSRWKNISTDCTSYY